MANKNFNVMIVLPSLERGNVERYSIDLAIELKANGHNVVVVSAGGILLKELRRADVDHIQLPVNSTDIFKIHSNAKILAKIIKDMRINIVHANSRATAWVCSLACKGTDTKLITTFHSIYDNGFLGWKKFYNRFMVAGDAIIAPSLFLAEHIVKNYHTSSDKIFIVNNWFDSDNFGNGAVSVERIIKTANTLHIPEDKRVISLIGKIIKSQGQILFIDTIAKLKRDDVVAFIVGNGSENFKNKLRKKIADLNLQRVINIINEVDVPAVYALSDVIVNAATYPTGFAHDILEAAAMGRTVVAANHGSACDIIVNDKTGKLVNANDVDALADGISWALNLSEEDRRALSSNASKHAHFNFSKSAKINYIMDIYEKLLKNQK
ncbi:MAG: glycosyltransferase family 4 protein [Rickettsiales bacterium]|nr:glycosyltransferase family 4 protein [Rickettsiales bacterium]